MAYRGFEEDLTSLESHFVGDWCLLAQIDPGTVETSRATITILEHPVTFKAGWHLIFLLRSF